MDDLDVENACSEGEGPAECANEPPRPNGILFPQPKKRKPEFWQCIELVAPSTDARRVSEAIGAWCTVCNTSVPWKKGESHSIQNHMNRHHSSLLKTFAVNKRSKVIEKRSTMKDFFLKKGEKQKYASKADQNLFEILVTKWIAKSLRPFSFVQDEGFKNVCEYLCMLNKSVVLPSRNTIRDRTAKLSAVVKEEMKILFSNELEHFAATTDMWSGRTREAFLALTIHYLTKDFQIRNFTIEVSPVRERHTAVNIADWISRSFQKWMLSIDMLSIMSRDNGSNVVAACNKLKINHFGCIGHGLHLVVDPFLRGKSGVSDAFMEDENSEPTLQEFKLEDDEDNVASYNSDLENDNVPMDVSMAIETLECTHFIENVRETTAQLRRIAKYLKNSTLAKEKVQQFHSLVTSQQGAATDMINVFLDVSTRWNSAYDMLSKLLKYKSSITMFLAHLRTPDGRNEFSRKSLPVITEMGWGTMEGMCILLKAFYDMTRELSGEKYFTLVCAFRLLRHVKGTLNDTSFFTQNNSGPLRKNVQKFLTKYSDTPQFKQILQHLDGCRVILSDSFSNCFRGLNYDLLWIGYLDPRQTDTRHLTDVEKERAKITFQNETAAMINDPELTSASSDNNSSSEDDACIDFASFFNGPQDPIPQIQSTDVEIAAFRQKRASLKIENYFLVTKKVKKRQDILQWWSCNASVFPNISKLARKWLSCPATSTPSERKFSDCGLVQTAKRSRLLGSAIKDQIMIRRNIEALNIDLSSVQLS